MNEASSTFARTPLVLALAMALGAGSAGAATITVTDGGDAGSAGTCTLRQAVESANVDSAGGSSCAAGADEDVIVFAASLANATITLDGLHLDVLANQEWQGSGQTIDAAGNSRVVSVTQRARLAASNLTMTGGDVKYGGGIELKSQAELDLVGVTISGNSASTQSAQGGLGGGIYAINDNTITLANSTVSGNDADAIGGGIYMRKGSLEIAGSTISDNMAVDSAGGIHASIGDSTTASVAIMNSIVSANAAPANPDFASDGMGGSDVAVAHSLLGSALEASLGGNGNVFSNAPGLGALADNGGATWTMLPQATSLAVDSGDNMLNPPGLTTDQRGAGFDRIVNGTVDIGAVELQSTSSNDTIFRNGFE